MRAPDNFTFFSLVLLTLCTTKPMAAPVESSAVSPSRMRATIHVHDHVQQRTAVPRIVLRRPS